MDYDMTIIVFPNDRKGNEAAPVMRGNVTVAGKKYDIALWSKLDKNGGKFWSGKVQEPQQKGRDLRQRQTADDGLPNF